MLSASVASQMVFILSLKQMAGGWVSVLIGVKEGEMKMTQIIVYRAGF